MQQLKDRWPDNQERQLSRFTDEEYRYLKSIIYIYVCTNPNWAPIEYRESSKPAGISIDVLDVVTNKIELKVKFINTKSLKESLEYIKKGECDLLPSLVYTSHKVKDMWFSRPYITYKLAIITREDKPIVTNLKSLSGRVMSAKEGSAIVTLMKQKYSHIKIVEVDSYKKALEQVRAGEVYFTVVTLPVLSYC